MTRVKHRNALRTAIMLVVVVGAGCAQFTIRADRNPATDFARYRTFAWMPIAAAPPADQDAGGRGLENRIYSAVEGELQRRGYAPAASGAADLLVTFRILRNDGFDDADIPYAAQWHRGAYVAALHASDDTYVRGTLIVDAVDRTQNMLVWRGSASARLLPHASYEKKVDRAESAIAQILATFPAH